MICSQLLSQHLVTKPDNRLSSSWCGEDLSVVMILPSKSKPVPWAMGSISVATSGPDRPHREAGTREQLSLTWAHPTCQSDSVLCGAVLDPSGAGSVILVEGTRLCPTLLLLSLA